MKYHEIPVNGGHALWCRERFANLTRHMIIYDAPLYDTPLGVEDRRMRAFLSDAGYGFALAAQQRGEIRIIKHYAVVEGHILEQ